MPTKNIISDRPVSLKTRMARLTRAAEILLSTEGHQETPYSCNRVKKTCGLNESRLYSAAMAPGEGLQLCPMDIVRHVYEGGTYPSSDILQTNWSDECGEFRALMVLMYRDSLS